MKSLLSMAGFLSASAAVHVAALLQVAGPGPGGGEEPPAGAEVTLAAAAPDLAALVSAWERPPAAVTVPDAPPVPDVTAAPAAALPAAALTSAALPEPRPIPTVPEALPAPGAVDRPAAPGAAANPVLPPPVIASGPARSDPPAGAGEVAQVPAVPASPEPPRSAPPAAVQAGLAVQPPAADVTAPEPPPLRKAMPRPVPPSKTGASGGSARPAAATVAAAPASAGPRQADLLADWGGEIRMRIARQKRYPAGTRAEGEALLRIDVGTDGRLRAVELARSAGDPRLDRAALAAVRGAQLPRAPKGLATGVRRFNLPMRFER